MRIVFVRHGDPNYEKDCLTDKGKVQARLAAQRLLEEGIEEIWSSPYGRAMETAQAFSEVSGMEVRILPFMHELDWGSRNGEPTFADGHPWDIADEMAHRGIDLNCPDWRELSYFRNNRVVDNIDLVEQGIDEWLAGFGYERKGFYYEHKAEEKEHRTVALFSHGGSSCAAMGHILNLPFPYMCALLHLEFTGITILRLEKKAGLTTLPCLELGNDGKHLGGKE